MSKEKAILFSGPMVRAILEGRKTQTRRVCRNNGKTGNEQIWAVGEPPWELNDKLWVKERLFWDPDFGWRYYSNTGMPDKDDEKLSNYSHAQTSCPSIFMKREASRLTLEVKSIRSERLQDISLEDAYAEGVGHLPGCSHIDLFRELWDSLTGKKYPWYSNPWVWVITFVKL